MSIVFLVSVAESTLVKQADCYLCISADILVDSLLHKSKLAQQACEGHRVRWYEVRILETGSNDRYRKYKESAHMACLTNPINQLILKISPISKR
jgi:hypothetical protein